LTATIPLIQGDSWNLQVLAVVSGNRGYLKEYYYKLLMFRISKNVKDKAFEVLKIKEFTFVNDCFQNKNNAVFGVFLQRLSKWIP